MMMMMIMMVTMIVTMMVAMMTMMMVTMVMMMMMPHAAASALQQLKESPHPQCVGPQTSVRRFLFDRVWGKVSLGAVSAGPYTSWPPPQRGVARRRNTQPQPHPSGISDVAEAQPRRMTADEKRLARSACAAARPGRLRARSRGLPTVVAQ